MKVAVFGGAGYIGSHVVLALQDAGHTPIVFDNLSTGKKENVKSTSVEFFKGDITDEQEVEEFFHTYSVDAVIHLAAKKAVGESMEFPQRYAKNNLLGSIVLLNAMVKAGVLKLVFSSSAAVYGSPQQLPITENTPKVPTNFYGFTKLEMERLFEWYTKLGKLSVVNLRYFNAVGYDVNGRITSAEDQPANLLPVIMEVLSGNSEMLTVFGDDYDSQDGTCIRDYIHVSDLADAHVKSLIYLEENTFLSVNLGTGVGSSVKECVDSAKKIFGDFLVVYGERRDGDPPELFANASLAKETLGWTAQITDLDEIIASMKWAYPKVK